MDDEKGAHSPYLPLFHPNVLVFLRFILFSMESREPLQEWSSGKRMSKYIGEM